MVNNRWRALVLVLVGVLTLAGCAATQTPTGSGGGDASSWPQRPIRWIISFDPGGGSDTEARRIQKALEDELGTTIQLEYREGGGGAVGWSEAAKAAPDGYTVTGIVVPHIVIQPLALKNPGYGTQELQIAAITVGGPAALMVRKESPLKSLDDFVKFARKNPGELTVGGVETYSGSDLALAQVVGPADIEVKYVPITGGAEPVLSSLFGGHVDSAMISTPHAVQNSDRVRTLAVGGEERFKGLEDIPTFKEEGYDVTVSYAWGVAFPPGVPKEIVGRFGEATLTAMRESGAVEQVTQEGLLPLTMGPEEAEQYVQKQIPVYRELLPVLQRFSG